ncbi:hypothetical protein BJ085DRAFT_10532, partial [Dimargaris cristalligena]
HPLALININDHYTRVAVQSGDKDSRVVFGALLGTLSDRETQIFSTYEWKTLPGSSTNQPEFDSAFMTEKGSMMKEVFPQYEMIGWYCTGVQTGDVERRLHARLSQGPECPYLLIVDPRPMATGQEQQLPIQVLEVVPTPESTATTDVAAAVKWVPAAFNIVTDEEERIVTKQLVNDASGGDLGGEVQPLSTSLFLQSHLSAVQMLQSRLAIIQTYLVDIRAGKRSPDHVLLWRIKSLCHSLPSSDS